MKKILYLAGFILIFFEAFPQMLTVKDKISNTPLEMVALYNKTMDITAVTNAQGKVDISKFAGVDTIYIKHIGYKTKKLNYVQIQQKNFMVYMTYDPVTLEQYVVSASRWQQKKTDVPQKISSIKPSDVLLHNPQTAADLLTLSGDVFMQKSQLGGGSPMIRGFATNRVLIAVDNVRMNTAIFRSGNVQNVISLDPFTVENTEVIFGPGSVIYGSDAIGGVMSFYTTKPQLSLNDEALIKVNLSGRFSSANNENTGHLDVNMGFKKIAFLTSFTYSDFSDLKMGNNGPDDYLRPLYADRINNKDTLITNPDPLIQIPTAYNQYNVMQKVLYRLSDEWTLNYGFHYSETSDYARYDRLIRPKGNGLRSAEWIYGPQKWMMNMLSILHKKSTKLYDNVNVNLAWQKFEESRIDRDFGKDTRFKRIEKVAAYAANLDFEKKINEKSTLLYGGEYIFNKINSTGFDEDVVSGISEPGASRYPDNSDWQSLAAYINAVYNMNDKITLQSGLRYNHYYLNAVFDTTFYPFPFSTANLDNGALIGSVGIVYKPTPSWQFIANASTGFRSPNIDDIGKVFDSSPGSVVVPNPSLKSEYAYNIDLGVAKRFSEYLKVDATAFYTLLKDALVRRDYVLNGADSIMYDGEMSQVQALQNAAAAYVKGVQGRIEISTPWNIELSSQFNIIKGEEELDNGDKAPLRHAPPFYGSTQLSYALDKLKLTLYSIYNGEVSYENLCPEQQKIDYIYAKDANGKPYTPAFTTYNFKLMYQLNDNLMLSAGVENITDIRYKPYSSGIVAPGRNYIISVKGSF